MLLHFYLIVNSKGQLRLVINKAPLKVDEISIQISVKIPRTIFNRPQLRASLEVPESAVQMPEVSVEAVADIEKAIQQSTGLNLTISIGEPSS